VSRPLQPWGILIQALERRGYRADQLTSAWRLTDPEIESIKAQHRETTEIYWRIYDEPEGPYSDHLLDLVMEERVAQCIDLIETATRIRCSG
jgi:hypothetical protein